MKKNVLKSVLLGVLAALAVGLILLPTELRNHFKHPAGIEQNKPQLTIHNKLSGLARKSASAEWFMHQRNYPLGYIPENAELRALEDMRTRMIPELAAKGVRLAKSAAGQLNWEHRGPGNIGGRLRGLTVHPNNPNILYAGSVSGGVWKSTNGGATWAPTMNDLITLNISALAMKPDDPNTLYAGTGEAFFTADCLPGRGLLKTTDGGNTWKRVHVAQGLNSPFITAIAVSPVNPNVVYAAGRQAVPQFSVPAESVPDPGVSAIFKSTDGGENWQDITTGKGIDPNPQIVADNFATDVVASPADANVVYAAFGIFASGGIWKSTNGGQTWSRLTTGLPDPTLPNQAYSRIKLAMAPSNPNILYASFAYAKKDGDTVDLKDEALLGVWKTTNGGQNWTQVATPLTGNQRNRDSGNTTALGSQGTYANALIVHPNNPDIVFLAGLDIYKSTDGGNTWSQVSMWIPPGSPANPENLPYVHADHHIFAFDLSTNPPTLYNGSDGGIVRSRDLGTTWNILNHDLGVTQFYYFAAHPTNPNIMFGGTQDNGTPMVLDGTINAWSEVIGGDGGPTYFDYNDPNTIYASYYRVNMFRLGMNYAARQMVDAKEIGFTDGSNGITQDDVNGAKFFAPFELSPNNPNVLVLGTNRLLKSTNRGDSWTPLTNAISVPIVSVAIADGNDNIIWVATDGAKIYKTEDNGGSFANVTGANLPNRFITDIEFDPSNNRTVYLTYSGYGAPHVFKSTDAGANWANITNNLPDAPANTIQVHPQQPNTIFLGTDIGVFLSENGGQTWQPCTNGFPTVPVVSIVLNTNLTRIFAATHGRGVFSAQLSGGGGAAVLSVDAQEMNIDVKPEQVGNASFNISNNGGAALNYSITTSGQFGKASLSTLNGMAGLSHAKVASRSFLPIRKSRGTGEIKAKMQSLSAAAAEFSSAPYLSVAGNDVLVLDDGNDAPDDFVGEGPNSPNDFYWLNQFDLTGQGFQLEAIQVYMRTETAGINTIAVAVMDTNGNDLVRGNVTLGLSTTGRWYMVQLNAPLSFAAGQGFLIEVGADASIAFPAGTDKHAQVRNHSYYFDWDNIVYQNLNTVAGFEQGAFMIRAVGTKTGSANQPPVARAVVSKLQANVNETLTFDASQSIDPDGQIVQYVWNFGDGNTGNQKVTTHAYTQAGTFTVTLTVTDNLGATGQVSGQITITGGSNQPPVARGQISSTNVHVNEAVTFDASTSSDPDGQITQYLWNFGDGVTSTQTIATHAYAQAGTFTVTLTVTDNQGATGQASGQITVTPATTSRLTVDPVSGTIAAGGAQSINVRFDAQGLAEGNYVGQIYIVSNGGNQTIPVQIRVSNNIVSVAELSYDNGTPTTAYNWPQAGQGSAVRFTPPSKPAKVKQAKIFITDIANGSQFNLRILTDANGKPGSTIYGPTPVTATNTGWATFDLNAANISVNGDFYAMIEYNGTSKPDFGSETTTPISKRSWDFDGQNWVLFDTEDYLIRAVVEYTTSVADHNGETSTPERFELAQNYPNPFNPETTIKYQLPEQAQVDLAVYDLTGRRVAIMESGMKETGKHLVRWDGCNDEGQRVASGVYFYRLQATPNHGQSWVMTKKMTLMK